MRTLLGHLAQFSSFSKQGELLCTQGLAYLLQRADARSAFAAWLSSQVGVNVSADLVWRAEVRQADGGRPDLEAGTGAGKPVIKIEAKLDADFNADQFTSYASDLRRLGQGGMLFVLVPRHRAREANDAVAGALRLSGPAPWRLTDGSNIAVAVVHWDEGIEALSEIEDKSFQSELTQFRSMYRVLNGHDIEPLASRDELVEWRNREPAFVALVDRVTRRLADTDRVMPMFVTPLDNEPAGLEAKGFRHRYLSRPLGDKRPWFSLGVRDFFEGYDTPVWLRFHSDTPLLAIIRERLLSSSIGRGRRVVEDGGHVWIAIEVPIHADGERMVDVLIAQAEEVICIAYAPLP